MMRERSQVAGAISILVTLAVVAALVAWGALVLTAGHQGHEQTAPDRVVSLSPALTETLFAIGAGRLVVGISDYCDQPPEATHLPRAGTAITPNFEALARLRPTLILTESSSGTRLDHLRALADTRALRWLSLADVTEGTRELGRLTGHAPEAAQLGERLEQRLTRPPTTDAPSVLLLLASGQVRTEQLWFVRRNSLHGQALAAAGGRNAVDEDVTGPPSLSLERLLAIDPEIIIALGGQPGSDGLAAIRGVHVLRAVRDRRLGAVNDASLLVPGPRILSLVDALEEQIAVLGAGL